ncbi:MAG: DinB family protein [Gemmatimonadota bacterium]
MLLAQLKRLIEHAEWANAHLVAALSRQPVAHDVIELFAHVLGAEEVWLSRLEGRKATLAVWPALNVEQLAAAAASNAAAWRAYVGRLTQDDLAREVSYVNSAGQAFTSRIVDILTHVAMHGSYHRGQVSLRIRRDGGTPAPTDFIAFVRGSPAATRQSAVRQRSDKA